MFNLFETLMISSPYLNFSSLPLNEISNLASRNISNGLGPNTVVAVDAVAAKVKLLAARTQYLSLIPTFNTSTSGIDVKVDIFTDTNMFNMWRWELASIDLLPDDKKASVKKARGSRKRLKYHQKAILKLVQSIDDFESFLKNASKTKENQQRRIAKISTDEEKVLKYEREEEKARLLLEAKVQKEKEKRQKLIEKEAEKDRKKEEVTKKQAEKARLEAEKGIATKKQKARMMSFFMTNKSTKAKPDVSDVSNSDENVKLYSQNSSNLPLDSGTFWKQLGCGDSRGGYFNNFSSSAINSRRRKTRKVNIRVFATVVSENPFEQQPYDEERVISVWNKKKYFNFHEDYRPPYHGTWNKPRSKIISGKNPFGKDTTFLNYDVDSEAEWEEGDNEQGDDCSIEDKDEEEHEEDEDTTKYNYQDGWLTQDADLALDDDDEETMVMRKQKAEGTIVSEGDSCHHKKLVPACIIAPIMGGLPQLDDTTECPQLVSELVEGIRVNEAHELLSSHEGELLMPSSVELCFDPFPLVKSEKKPPESKSQQDNATKKSSQEMSEDDMRTLAKFVHNCTLNSKELIVEDFRMTHNGVIPSRAQGHRKIDLIATKRRLKKGGGVIWEVKRRFLESLGLHSLIVSTRR
jgi:chromatin assembly factor 1 subunit A